MTLQLSAVVSRSTVAALKAITARATSRQPSICRYAAVPVDFRCSDTVFEICDNKVTWCGAVVPPDALQRCLTQNVAYRMQVSVPLGVSPTCESDTSIMHMTALFIEEDLSSGVPALKVAEPNEEDHSSRGPVLWVEGMKMHISNNVLDTRKFSQLLARSCGRLGIGERSFVGGVALDLFYGLGISAGEMFRLGASHVVGFEKPEHAVVRGFASLLPSPSVVGASAQDSRLTYHLCDLEEWPPKIFDILKADGRLFDAVIVDPPKRSIMDIVYSRKFLKLLAGYLYPGAVVSCYAPDISLHRRKKATPDSAKSRTRSIRTCRSWTDRFLDNFLRDGMYRALPTTHTNIMRFRRTF